MRVDRMDMHTDMVDISRFIERENNFKFAGPLSAMDNGPFVYFDRKFRK